MINLTEEPRSPWNITAGCVFIDQKMVYNDTQETCKAIEKAFTNWLRSLRSCHKQEALSWADRASERSKHSWQQHKYQVCLPFLFCNVIAHLESCCFYATEALQSSLIHLKGTLILDILDALGTKGMSSDKSDVDCNSKQVTDTVVKPDWQHPNLHYWLKVFDQLHHQNHINSWSLDKHGMFPHICIRSQKVHKKVQVLSGLLINTYDPKWLEGQEALCETCVVSEYEEIYVCPFLWCDCIHLKFTSHSISNFNCFYLQTIVSWTMNAQTRM